MAKRKKWKVLVLFGIMMLTAACGQKAEKTNENKYNIYCVNPDETAVISYEYTTQSTETDGVIQELIGQMETIPERLEYKAPLAGSFALLDYSLTEGQLLLNFDESYKSQEITTEILTRAAIVRTLMQVKDVQHISFLVSSEPLIDASGSVVGFMNNDTFIDNAGNEINTYEKVKLQLYFANEAGDGLSAVSRTKVYNSNVSLDRLVVEEIIGGPKEGDTGITGSKQVYPVVNPDTKIIRVSVRDGICYVNLDEGFLTQIHNVTPEVTIYALTNSLVELPNVNKVQISVAGETNVNYREKISLSAMFERNLDLVK